uniref:U6 snRNA-associated Sm-like protein LSm4 n=1 Tax=Oryzias sinensis TaxID=183150 RepID=A0A8C8DZM1_9TELE
QLPLSLLKTAQNHPMLVELKNGETYNGHLVSCDNWMNINLREVICTSRVTDLLSCSHPRGLEFDTPDLQVYF